MKVYFNVILLTSVALLLFPFLGFPELWENIYVVLLAFVIAYTSLLLRHKISLKMGTGTKDESSLDEYIHELKKNFHKHDNKEFGQTRNEQKKISDIHLDD